MSLPGTPATGLAGRTRWAAALALAAVCLLLSDVAWSVDTTPLLINYQGRLTDSSGAPINGNRDVYFRYYDASTAGNLLYAESRTFANGNPVVVTLGNYAVALGGGTRVAPPNDGSAANFKSMFAASAVVWLEIEVSTDGAAMTPRIRVLAAGFAINADLLDGYDSSDLVKKAGDTMTGALNLPSNGLAVGTSQLVVSGGNVGIGTLAPAQPLSVAGTIQSTSGGFKFPDGSVQTAAAAGKVIGVTYQENSTRATMSAVASITMESFTVNKKSPTSLLIIQGTVCGFTAVNAAMCSGWKYGSGAEVVSQTMIYGGGTSYTQVFPTTAVIAGHTTTGPQTLVFRFFTQDSTAGTVPFTRYNPNASDDARLGQTKSVYIVWEVEP